MRIESTLVGYQMKRRISTGLITRTPPMRTWQPSKEHHMVPSFWCLYFRLTEMPKARIPPTPHRSDSVWPHSPAF